MSLITALGDLALPLLGFLPPAKDVVASALIDGVVKLVGKVSKYDILLFLSYTCFRICISRRIF